MKQKGKICGLSLSRDGGLESFSVRIDFRVGEKHLTKNETLKMGQFGDDVEFDLKEVKEGYEISNVVNLRLEKNFKNQ